MLENLVSWLGITMVFVLGYAIGVIHMIYMDRDNDMFGGDK